MFDCSVQQTLNSINKSLLSVSAVENIIMQVKEI